MRTLAWTICVLFLGGMVSVGCATAARQAGKESAKGAVQGIQEEAQGQSSGGSGAPVAEKVSQGLVDAALEQLSSPEGLERLRAITRAVASELIRAAATPAPALGGSAQNDNAGTGGSGVSSSAPVAQLSRQVVQSASAELESALSRQLGENGDGPVAKSLVALTEQVAAGVARGAVASVDRSSVLEGTTLDNRVSDVSRAAGAGFIAGVAQQLGFWPYIATFVGGMLVAFVLVLLFRGQRPSLHRG